MRCQDMMGPPHVTECGGAWELPTCWLQQAQKSKTRCLSKLDCTNECPATDIRPHRLVQQSTNK